MASDGNMGEAYEAEHVHAVYEQIAPHFSSTRYKPWPIVENFLKELPGGAVGLDIGCGNGKYLAVNPHVFIVGSDRSTNLTKFAAKHQPHSAIVADGLALPHPPGSFDFAICIAVLHHLSTPERRVEAVKAILEMLKPPSAGANPGPDSLDDHPGGRALVYVWALEQKSSRRGWGEGDAQDIMVPWVMQKQQVTKKDKKVANAGKGKKNTAGTDANTPTPQDQEDNSKPESEPPTVYQRYYHLYKKGELESDVSQAGGRVLDSGYDRDNWWVVTARIA